MPDLVPPDEETRHERLRIARDLHDTVAQRLAAVGFSLDAVIADEVIPAQQKRSLREMRLEVSAVVQELRNEILALRQDNASSLESWLRERLDIEILWHRLADAILPHGHEEDVRYLLLELIHNAIVHRGLTMSAIKEDRRTFDVSFLGFADQLSPFAPAPVPKERNPSFGRVGILERSHRLGLRLDEREEGFALLW